MGSFLKTLPCSFRFLEWMSANHSGCHLPIPMIGNESPSLPFYLAAKKVHRKVTQGVPTKVQPPAPGKPVAGKRERAGTTGHSPTKAEQSRSVVLLHPKRSTQIPSFEQPTVRGYVQLLPNCLQNNVVAVT